MKSILIKTAKTLSESNTDVSVFRLKKLLKNYRKAQTNFLTIAVAMSIVNIGVLFFGQSNQTLAVEPAESTERQWQGRFWGRSRSSRDGQSHDNPCHTSI